MGVSRNEELKMMIKENKEIQNTSDERKLQFKDDKPLMKVENSHNAKENWKTIIDYEHLLITIRNTALNLFKDKLSKQLYDHWISLPTPSILGPPIDNDRTFTNQILQVKLLDENYDYIGEVDTEQKPHGYGIMLFRIPDYQITEGYWKHGL